MLQYYTTCKSHGVEILMTRKCSPLQVKAGDKLITLDYEDYKTGIIKKEKELVFGTTL